MSVVDFAELTRDDILEKGENMDEDSYSLIPHPTNEPVIGVIDTHFNEKVYFHEWVEYKNLLDPNIPLVDKDYEHGTEVSYIIVWRTYFHFFFSLSNRNIRTCNNKNNIIFTLYMIQFCRFG